MRARPRRDAWIAWTGDIEGHSFRARRGRNNASDCIALARKSRTPEHRDLLLGLAAKWLELAGAKRHEIELITKKARPG